jgi:hypothetical protein
VALIVLRLRLDCAAVKGSVREFAFRARGFEDSGSGLEPAEQVCFEFFLVLVWAVEVQWARTFLDRLLLEVSGDPVEDLAFG